MHAAVEGKLPAALAEIKAVRVPVDPYSGQPFPYSRDGETVSLSFPSGPKNIPSPQDKQVYLVKLRK